MTSLADLNALDHDAIEAALSGPPEQAAAFIRTAAEAGHAEAQVMLGQILLDGRGVPADAVQALQWFIKAAQQGHAMAMNMVGRSYENGWGIAADAARAAEWYRAAAERGLDWGLYNLATLLTLGNGVAEDKAEALALFRRAADLGHAKSINMVGSFYEDGWIVSRDMTVAAEHYCRAAQGGDFRGMFNHARILIDRGEIDEAIGWLRRLPETATPAFLGKVRLWLDQRPEPLLRAAAAELLPR